MRSAVVKVNGQIAGYLTENDDRSFVFVYDTPYLADAKSTAISLTLPLRTEPYVSQTLFPFFYNMLAEGNNKAILCRKLKIDEEDYFGLLLATGSHDAIGAVTIFKKGENGTD
jgi:serine/threonine-protein kinase HipA